jgi:(2Fe-2S) ferredoxin
MYKQLTSLTGTGMQQCAVSKLLTAAVLLPGCWYTNVNAQADAVVVDTFHTQATHVTHERKQLLTPGTTEGDNA